MSHLKIDNLAKKFPAFQLGPIDFELHPGDSLALFGKNGAGKTTLFQLITGNMDATGGEATLEKRRIKPDIPEVKRRLGYLPQDAVLPKWSTPNEVLAYAARLYELPMPQEKTQERLAFWDCLDFGTRPISLCSYGMQKRVGLALATLHNPDVLILDEPFSGLDMFHIQALFQTIEQRIKQKSITILSTHVAPFASRLCNRAAILERGLFAEQSQWAALGETERTRMIEHLFFEPNPS